jgi:hypothetical protein
MSTQDQWNGKLNNLPIGPYARRDPALVWIANRILRLASKRYQLGLKTLVVAGMKKRDEERREWEVE